MRCSIHRTSVAAVALGMLLASIGTTAVAAPPGPTRDQYRERVERVCKAGTLANQDVLRGVEQMIRRGELRPAGTRFLRAAAALERVVGRLATVPRPPADVERLSRWLGHAKRGAALLRRAGDAFRRGRRSEAEDMAERLLREAKRANAVVIGFDFDHCRLNPARFV